MRLPIQAIQAKRFKLAAGLLILIVLGYSVHWYRSRAPQAGADDGTGEFLLVDAADRSLDGEPALALTFTRPLDSRQNYDRFIQVFEMPAVARPATDTRSGEDEENSRANRVSIVSTKPEDTVTTNGKVVSGAWIVGDNPRLLYFPHIKPETRYVVLVSTGIEARSGGKLATDSKYSVQTAPVSPAYYFASNGTVLPAKQNGGLPVVTVNVPEVDVQFLRVKNDKLPEFMDRVISRPKSRQKSDPEESDEEESYDYRRSSLKGAVGNYQLDAIHDLTESIYLGRFSTEKKPNKRSVTYISVEDIRELAEPGVYVAIMSQPGRFRYDFQTTYFYVSDLGMQLRLFEKTADVFVSSLVTGKAVSGVDTAWMDGNGKTLATGSTDNDGHHAFAEIPKDARIVMARKDKQVSIVALKEPALDLSEYDVVGPPSKAVRLFAYTGRDLYRPGESFDVSVLARDADGRTVPAQPIQAVLKDPGGHRQFTSIWKPDMRFPGYYLKHLDLPADAATGLWTLELRADPADKTPGTSYRFGVEEFLPERMKLDLSSTQATLAADQTFAIAARGSYLYGAPASGNRLLGVAEFERNKNPLSGKFPGFEFGDVREDTNKIRTELPEQSLNPEGVAQVRIDLKDTAGKHSPFTVRGTLSLLESGGRPVIRKIESVVWPAVVMTGVRPLFTGDYAREGSRAEFEILRSDRDGNLKAAAAMPVRLFRENREYYWRFDDQRGWHSGFTETDELVETTTVTIPAGGRGKLGVPVQYGRYRLEIDDRETSQLLAYRFYAGWNSQGDETQGVRPDRVALKLDKPNYREGETAHLTITPPHQGEALITVEGDRTLWVKRTTISSDIATIDIPIDRQWQRHDLYVTVMVVRPGNAGSLVTPARALGLIYLPLDRADRKLTVTLEAPQKVRPDTTIRVKVRAPDAKGQMAFVTLSAVDAGILNITRFASPDPDGFFFGKLRYGPDLHDVYGRLIEKMQGQKGQLKFGGDNTPTPSRGLPKIVQLVDLFSGPIALDANGEAEIPLHAPDFNGTLRLMAVVAAANRFGAKDAEMTIAAPLITELATPRFLSFGDKAMMALDLQNLSGNPLDLKIALNSDGLQIENSERSLMLKNQEKQTLRFSVVAGFIPGVHTVTAKVSGANIKVERSFPLAVRPPTPQVTFARRYAIKAGDTIDIQDANLSGLHRDTALAHFVVSDKPPIDVRGAVRDLLQYPYGCAEQTTSTAYPHIFIDEDEARRLGLKPFTREQRVDILEKAVSKLAAMQAPNGGFSLWGNASDYDYWLSAYVTSFLVDAREQGFTVPDMVYNQATDFLMRGLQEGAARLPASTKANQPGPNAGNEIFRDYNNGRFDVLAHGAYVLAKQRKAPLSTLRVLYDLRAQTQSGLALVHLGIALNLMGDGVRGNAAIAEGLSSGRTGHATYDYYGTPLRDAALSYAMLDRHHIEAPGRENLLVLIANELERNRYYSTQEKISLFFVGRSLSAGGNGWSASLLSGGRAEQLSRKGTYFREVSPSELTSGIKLANTSKGTLYAELALTGNPVQQPPPQSDPIELGRTIYTADGHPLAGRTLRVGDTVLVKLTVRSRTAMSTGMVVDRIPAGLEIENLNLVQGESLGSVTIDGINPADAMMDNHIKHIEFRDDRFVAAVRLEAGYGNRFGGRDYGTLRLFYRARVVTPGEFIVPPLYAEDMYRPNIFGLYGGGETITVVDAK